ncbi:ethionine resistance protein [Coemansia sp. RSA 2131]|nr:ethionine resistance protein [Coemansia sp. RSA 2131]
MVAQTTGSNPRSSPARRQPPQTPSRRNDSGSSRDEVTWQSYSSSPCPVGMHTPTPSTAYVQAGQLLSQSATSPQRAPRIQQQTEAAASLAVSSVGGDHQTRSMSPRPRDFRYARAPRNMASMAHNAAAGAQVESYFSPAAPAEAAAGMGGSYLGTTPVQPRRQSIALQSRRQSIALQSSCSYQMPLSLPGRSPVALSTSPMRNLQQRMQPPAQGPSELCWSMTSTTSLPCGAQAPRSALSGMRPLSLTLVDSQTLSAQNDSRRRSAAHERYPPLTSIFEKAPNTRELMDDHIRAHLHSTSVAENYGALSASADLQFPLNRPLTMPSEVAPRFRSSGNIAGSNSRGLVEPRSPQSPPIQRSCSSSSLSSNFSASSVASTSSAQSSYAYIFDSARPSAGGISHSSKRSHRNADTVHFGSRAGRRSVGDILFGGSLFMFGGMTTHPRGEPSRSVESSPLLGDESASAATLGGHEQDPTPQVFAHEVKSILGTSSHLLLSSVLQAVISISQVVSSGHLGRSELAAIGLAHMVIVLTGYPVTFSVLSCLETFASQAYTSAQPRLVGAYFVRAIQLQWILGLVVGALWASSGPLLTYIVRDTSAATVALAVTYLRWYFVPYMVFSNLMCAKQMLYAQGVTYPFPYVTLLGTVVTLAAQYMLTFSPWFQLGVRGVALGGGAGYAAMLAAVMWIVRTHDGARVWDRHIGAAPWRPFLRLLPSCMVLAVLSTSTSELVTVVATQLGAVALSTQAVLSALSRTAAALVSGFGVASLNRVGNHIGQQSERSARIATYAALAIGVCAAVIGALTMLVCPSLWARVFTSDAEIVREIVVLVPVIAAVFAAQALAFVGSQLLSAQGRQALAARIKFGAVYVVGVPLGYYWAVVCGHGLAGLWSAVAVGQACSAVAETMVVLCTDWPRLIDYCSDSIIYAVI